MTTLLLALLYPLLVAARLFNALLGRDPLRRARPGAGSLWVERTSSSGDAGYFSEESPSENRSRASAAWLPESILVVLARWYAPPRLQPNEKFSAAADREQGIPDEMYTLW
jgi:hypothetical protein